MAEALTIISIVNGAVGLALKCGSVAKKLNDLAGKYQTAELSIKLLVQQVDTIKAAWDRIGQWSQGCQADSDEDINDVTLLQRLDRSLDCGDLVLSALEKELEPYKLERGPLGFVQRSKVIWNENSLQEHQTRLGHQVTAMTLLLEVLDLPTKDQGRSLEKSAAELRKCDESALSIVPSGMSMSASRISLISSESADMSYRRFSFEDDLFTARVYKRNYRNPQIRRLFQRDARPSHKKVPQLPRLDMIQHWERAYVAIQWGDVDAVQTLLAKGLDINIGPIDDDTNFYRGSLLHYATEKRVIPIMRLLLEHGAQIDVRDEFGGCPVHIAAAGGRLHFDGSFRPGFIPDLPDVLLLLVKYGADVNTRLEFVGSPKARNGQLLSKKPFIATPLMMASRSGQTHNVVALLASGADPNIYLVQEDYGTALYEAADRGHTSIVKTLLDHGANPNARSHSSSLTALHACMRTPLPEETKDFLLIARLLIEKGADIEAADISGDRILHALIHDQPYSEVSFHRDYHFQLVEYLLAEGASIDSTNNFGDTPLILAVMKLRVKLVEDFLCWCKVRPSQADLLLLESNTKSFRLRIKKGSTSENDRLALDSQNTLLDYNLRFKVRCAEAIERTLIDFRTAWY